MEKLELEETLAAVHALLQAEGMNEAAHVVRSYPANSERTGYDNWNGGTEIWEVQIAVPARDFARLGTKKAQIEEQISARLKTVAEQETQNWYTAKIVPERERRQDWRAESSSVPRDVRTNIFDGMKLEGIAWNGALDEVEFLSRIYDLKELPSHDHRFKDAARDIWQHRINNEDWDADWVFSDSRFKLGDGPSDQFLRFLCETVHPVIRPDRDEASNSCLTSISSCDKLDGSYTR